MDTASAVLESEAYKYMKIRKTLAAMGVAAMLATSAVPTFAATAIYSGLGSSHAKTMAEVKRLSAAAVASGELSSVASNAIKGIDFSKMDFSKIVVVK